MNRADPQFFETREYSTCLCIDWSSPWPFARSAPVAIELHAAPTHPSIKKIAEPENWPFVHSLERKLRDAGFVVTTRSEQLPDRE